MLATTRHNRFWIIGIFLVFIPLAWLAVSKFALREPLTTLDAVFHGLVIIVGISLLDRELAFGLLGRFARLLLFWKRGESADPLATPAPPSKPPTNFGGA